MIDIEKQTIWTNFMMDKDSASKIKSVDVRILTLLSNLTIQNYTTYTKIITILVALAPISFPEKERLVVRKKFNKLEIYINLDYKKLLVSTETETLQLIAQTYLLAIERFLMHRKDFDAKKFYTDVEKLFRENGVL